MALWVKQNPTAGCCGNNWPAKNEGRGLEGRGCQDSDSIISLTFLCLFTLLSGCFLGNEPPRRKRTGYLSKEVFVLNAASDGEYNPIRIQDKGIRFTLVETLT